ncbi:MAG: hypothetical protein AAFV53_18510 [Myxococcota bacterium]
MSKKQVDDSLRTLQIIALAFMSSGVLYVGALYMLGFADPSPLDDVQMMGAALSLMALSSAASSFIVPRIAAPMKPTPNMTPVDELTLGLNQYRVRTILAFVMSEAVVLFGFALAYLGQTPWWCVPFWILMEALMLVHFPRRSAFLSELSEDARSLAG